MDQQLLQRTRYLLQTRFRKIRTTPAGNFELVAKQVLHWLENHPVIGAVIQYLDQIPGEHHEEIQLLVSSEINGSRYYNLSVKHTPKQDHEPEFRGYTPATLEEHASACLQIVRATIQRPNLEFYSLLAVYLTQEDYDYAFKRDKDPLEAIKDSAVRDLYEYLDERLDGINAVNGLLRKYKQNVEWFQQARIQEILSEGYGGKTGERAVALHLQQYIFDQGVEFVVEPSSVSGEVDVLLLIHLVSTQLLTQNSSNPVLHHQKLPGRLPRDSTKLHATVMITTKQKAFLPYSSMMTSLFL